MIGLRTTGICALAATLAVLAGCGGGGGNSTATELFAPPVATALGAMGPPLRVVDLDSDGKADVTVAARAATGTLDDLAIFLGNGDGTFRASGTIAGAANAAIADLDGDGKPDLVYCAGANALAVRLGKGNGTFGQIKQFGAVAHDRINRVEPRQSLAPHPGSPNGKKRQSDFLPRPNRRQMVKGLHCQMIRPATAILIGSNPRVVLIWNP